MKTHWIILLLITIISFSSFGCQNKGNPSTEVIHAIQTDPREENMATKLNEYSLDFDGDGALEKIELHTAAGRAEDGNMLWDDGQNWLLLVEDGKEYYPLLHQYVQLGVVYFTIWYDDKGTPKITVILETGANLSFFNYYYDREQQGYKVENIYDSGGINYIFSSIPNY